MIGTEASSDREEVFGRYQRLLEENDLEWHKKGLKQSRCLD